ncbi:MAG: hypothetical protein ACJ8F1_03075 [Polyangia bacterium]
MTDLSRGLRRPAMVVLAALVGLLAGAGCSSHNAHPQTHPDGGAAGHGGAGGGGGGIKPDGGGPDQAISTCGVTGPKIAIGNACGCDAECDSNHCVDGVCCATSCSGGCATCAASGSVGTCVMRVAGAPPRAAADCPADSPVSCGLDGLCDGAGGCRRYLGNTCIKGTCSGDTVVGAFACDGNGQCKPGVSLMLCVPYTCNPATSACYQSCDSAAMCQNGGSCDFASESCGKSQNGQSCTKDSGCISGHCVDKVCCNSACTGACTACNLPGRVGTCLPVDMGKPDPRAICVDQGAPSCGHTGTCDGVGGCANYTRDTQCLMPSCTGNRLNTAGTCDGLGTCRAPNVQNCHPFRCGDGACTKSCESDQDCDDGAICQNKTCGPKPPGFPCTGAAECASGFCVDQVCCESACTGTCHSCALPGSPGRCLTVAADNVDPRGECKDNGAAACGTNGKCDGTGSCARYAVGTPCESEKCTSGVYTPPSTCNATGQCVASDAHPCAPYVCNGTQCFNNCATNDQCKQPNSCVSNSCGLKVPPALCSSDAECVTGFCSQGVCCNSRCDGKCQSCALPTTTGTCTNVPAGAVDPTATCLDKGTGSCGTNGKCDGNGTCQLYAQGTTCLGSSCPAGSTTFTGVSACDGAGKCVTPNATPCFPYQCGATVCKNSCTTDGDCAQPAVCSSSGSCGLKGNGQSCAGAAECLSGFCAQGVCCGTACQGACQSCALANSLGTCSNVPFGASDPQGTCHDMGNASCGTDGFCDGSGACRLYAAATPCAPPSCPATSLTLASGRTCDGNGTCQAATNIACAPYVCNGTTSCRAACTSDADCQLPAICDQKLNLCGDKKRLGQACASTDECLSGNTCVDGVCCSTSACPTCQACNVTGSAGNCANVPANKPEPHSLCAPNPPCGDTGACDGAGKCQLGGTTVACGTATCLGSTFTPVSHCSGTGACAAPTSSACAGNFACGTSNACLTTCGSDSDCVAPFTCQGTGSSKSCARKPNGQACGAANQCISGFCTDGVCCGTGPCGTCQACNLNGAGSCAFFGPGATAPSGQCPVTTTCGNTGTCNGAGACTQAAASVTCGSATCTGTTFTPAPTCSGAGSCAPATATTCGAYVCGTGGACKTKCNGDTDCAAGNYCTGTGGSCLPVKANGATCGATHECTSGNCVDSVCCSASTCGTCLACNLNGLGTCSAVGAGVTDPHTRCVANGTCGNTGTCNGAGACTQAASSVSCGAASCTNGVATAAVTCTGTGACPIAGTTVCSPYVCGSTACKTTCNADTDCVAGNYCTGTGGSCTPKKALGVVCMAANQCTSGNCVDGACCSTASCGTCQSCGLNAAGTCANIGAGQTAPTGQCGITTTCGFTGTCDGAGACTLASSSTQCAPAVCAVGSVFYTPAASCSGAGTCGTATTKDCTPYLCRASGCPTTCDSDGDCIATDYCTGVGGSCVPRALAGVACSGDDQCATGHCTDGFCCGFASCGSCMSCGVAGVQGTCTALPAGNIDPSGICTAGAQAPSTCGHDGSCDGAGGCQWWPATTVCSAVTCPTGTSDRLAQFCDGGGTCSLVAVPVTHCAPFTCDGTMNSCLQSCSADTDCVAPATCQTGVCL